MNDYKSFLNVLKKLMILFLVLLLIFQHVCPSLNDFVLSFETLNRNKQGLKTLIKVNTCENL